MTVLASKNFDTGPNGAAVVAGSNELIVKTGSASLTYSALAPITGAFSGRVQAGSGEYCYLVEKVTAAGTLWYQVLFTTPPFAPSVPLFLVGVFSGNTPAMDVRLNTDMTLTIRDRGASSSLARWTSPALPFSTRIRATGKCSPAGGASALRGKLYVGETAMAGTTATYDSGDLTSTSALTTIDQVHTGVLYATTATWAVEFDALSIETTEPGPVTVNALPTAVTNNPPVVDAGDDQIVYPGTSTVTLTAIGSDPGGGIASYSWRAITSGAPVPSGTGAVRTLTSPVLRFDATHRYGVTVTDTGGMSSPESTVDITWKATTEWHCTSSGALVPMTIVNADGTASTPVTPVTPAPTTITHGQQINATNTGITYAGVSSSSLTATGATTYSTAGQVITGKRFTDTVVLNANGITLRNCQFDATGSDTKMISVLGTNCLIENCTIKPATGSAYMGIWASADGLTVRRCDISNCENNMTIEANACLVEYSYLHDSSNVSNTAGHRDCIEVYGGNDVTLRMNRLTHPAGETSVVNIAPYYGSSNVLRCQILDSFLDGGNMIVLVDLQSSGAIQQTKVLRCKMGGHTAPGVIGIYTALNNADGRAIVNTQSAQDANPNAIYWPTTGADVSYWDECSDLSPNRTGQVISP